MTSLSESTEKWLNRLAKDYQLTCTANAMLDLTINPNALAALREAYDAGAREQRELLKQGLRFLPDLIARKCGNVENTPCADRKASYVCGPHKWLKDVRAAIRAGKD